MYQSAPFCQTPPTVNLWLLYGRPKDPTDWQPGLRGYYHQYEIIVAANKVQSNARKTFLVKTTLHAATPQCSTTPMQPHPNAAPPQCSTTPRKTAYEVLVDRRLSVLRSSGHMAGYSCHKRDGLTVTLIANHSLYFGRDTFSMLISVVHVVHLV